MTLTPYFNPLAGMGPALTGGATLATHDHVFPQVPTPGVMSITNGTESLGGGGTRGDVIPSGAIIRMEESGLALSEKPALLLVTLMPDDSGSITSYGNAPAIRRGHNEYLEGFSQSPASILVRTRYLNGEVLFDFSKPRDAVRMNDHNYNPQQGTPLFDQSYHVLQEVLSAATVYADRHKDLDVFTMTFIMTDGADTGSSTSPAQVKDVVDRMFASGRHMVAGIGVRDGGTDFPAIFKSMGIPEQLIKVLERAEGDIVEGMTQISHMTRTVGNATSFKQTTITGFTGQPGAPVIPQRPASAPAAPARVVIRPTAHGPAAHAPFVPQKDPATAMPSASAIGNMMGATQKRGSAEVGGVPPQNLPWEPTQMAYYFDENGAMDAAPSPLQWNAAAGFYVASLPTDNLVYMFGRDGGQMQEDVRQRILALLKARREKNKPIRLLYVPLRDRRTESPISRMHALLGSLGAKVNTLAALDGDVTVISGDDPATDDYRQGKQGEKVFVNSGNRIKLAPHIVFMVV